MRVTSGPTPTQQPKQRWDKEKYWWLLGSPSSASSFYSVCMRDGWWQLMEEASPAKGVWLGGESLFNGSSKPTWISVHILCPEFSWIYAMSRERCLRPTEESGVEVSSFVGGCRWEQKRKDWREIVIWFSISQGPKFEFFSLLSFAH